MVLSIPVLVYLAISVVVLDPGNDGEGAMAEDGVEGSVGVPSDEETVETVGTRIVSVATGAHPAFRFDFDLNLRA